MSVEVKQNKPSRLLIAGKSPKPIPCPCGNDPPCKLVKCPIFFYCKNTRHQCILDGHQGFCPGCAGFLYMCREEIVPEDERDKLDDENPPEPEFKVGEKRLLVMEDDDVQRVAFTAKLEPFVYIALSHDSKTTDKWIVSARNHVMNVYQNIPTNLKFKHKAVNDYNQHLCGGWHLYKHSKTEEVDRVMEGLKPVGISHSLSKDVAEEKKIEADKRGFLTSIYEHKFGDEIRYWLTVSPKGVLGDFFDMKTLAADYVAQSFEWCGGVIEKYARVDFEAFHNGNFNIEKHPSAIVGLILGYPVENTISLLRRED